MMKIRRSRQQWLAIIADFEKSGLTITQFARREGLCPKYFSGRRNAFKSEPNKPHSFVPAIINKSNTSQTMELNHGAVTLTIPVDMNIQAVANLIKAL